MLPNLCGISLCRGVTATGGNLRNATWSDNDSPGDLQTASWGEGDVCALCLDSLSDDTETEANKWPSPNEGFLVKVCVTGHVYHKGCLRAMLRATPGAPCPECRNPILEEARSAVADATPEAQSNSGAYVFASGDDGDSYVRWEVYIKPVLPEDMDVSQYARRNFARYLAMLSRRWFEVSEAQWYSALNVIPGETTVVLGGRGSLGPDPVVGSLAFQLYFDRLGIDVRDFLLYVTRMGSTTWASLFGIAHAIVTSPRRASLRPLFEGADAADPLRMTGTEYDLWPRSALVDTNELQRREFESDGSSVLVQRTSVLSITTIR